MNDATYQRKWRRENPEKYNAYKRSYYLKNRKKILAASKRYYKKNIEKIREHSRKRYLEDKEYRERRRANAKRQTDSGYVRERYRQRKLGDVEVVKQICKDFGLSEEIAKAIADGGDLLDEKLKLHKLDSVTD